MDTGALKARIAKVMREEETHPRACPDLLIYLADLFNACDFATTAADLADIAAEFESIERAA